MIRRIGYRLRASAAAVAAAFAVPAGMGTVFLTVTNTSGAVAGSKVGTGLLTLDPPGAVVRGAMKVSRFSGVAPLYVNFDFTGTTSTLSTNPAHELYHYTDFGDPSSGTWANGVQSSGLTSKNTGLGPVTGHVYETPGTYTVTYVVTDGVNTSSRRATIVVQDPDSVYGDANTYYISHSGNFTGAPGAATNKINTAGNTDMYAAWNTYKASNKRILFCKADAWVSSLTVSLSGLTGVTLGGYGTGVAHTFASGTLVSVTPATGIGSMFQGGGSTDCHIYNFKIAADATHYGVATTTADSVALTLYKIEVRGATAGFSIIPSSGLNSLFVQDQSCVYECLVDQLYGYAISDCPTFAGASASNGGGVTTCIFTATAHPFKRFNTVRLFGTAPAGLSTGVNYYISASNLTANTFSLSSTFNTDTPLTSTGAGSCNVTGIGLSGGMCIFAAMTRGGIMGCYFDSCNHGEQVMRVPYINNGHINNNFLARPNQTKNILKMHSRGYDNIIGVSDGYSKKIQISANYLTLEGGYSYNEVIPNNGSIAAGETGDCSMTIGFGNSAEGIDERIQNIIVENNFTKTALGKPKSALLFVAASSPNFTVRNNIFDASIGDRSPGVLGTYPYTTLGFATTGSSQPNTPTTGVRFYNNSMYSNIYSPDTAFFVSIGPPVSTAVTAATGTPSVFTTVSAIAHNLSVNMRIRLLGTPPTPLVANTDYWVSATSFSATTFVLSATSGGANLVLSGTGSCRVTRYEQVNDVAIKNNLWYYDGMNPAMAYISAYTYSGTPPAIPTNVVATNNTDNVQNARVSPNFVATPPVLLTDWRPTTGSYAIRAVGTPDVLRDFNNVARVGGTYAHLGAILP